MKRPRISLPKEAVLKRAVDARLCLRYAELLHLRKVVEDAEATARANMGVQRITARTTDSSTRR
jgi:hypothetical protein